MTYGRASLFEIVRRDDGAFYVLRGERVASTHNRRSDAEAWVVTVTHPFGERIGTDPHGWDVDE